MDDNNRGATLYRFSLSAPEPKLYSFPMPLLTIHEAPKAIAIEMASTYLTWLLKRPIKYYQQRVGQVSNKFEPYDLSSGLWKSINHCPVQLHGYDPARAYLACFELTNESAGNIYF
jgi:hypothetical protein